MTEDTREPCCRDPENLYVYAVDTQGNAVLTERRCKVCGRRHFNAALPAIRVGVKGS